MFAYDEELSFEEELSDTDVFKKEDKNDASDEDQHFSDDNDDVEEDQAAITAGNATCYYMPFPSRLRQKNI